MNKCLSLNIHINSLYYYNKFKLIRMNISTNNTSLISTANSLTEDDKYVRIEEGSAVMLYDKKEAVFYNKVQVLNRDLSIQVIRLFSNIRENEKNQVYNKKLKRYEELLLINSSNNNKPPRRPIPGINILDALAATGLRSIRYVKEIENVRHITINDISTDATKAARENCITNNVDMNKVKIITSDATTLMYNHRSSCNNSNFIEKSEDNDLSDDTQYDVIDIDPYGSAAPFIDSAIQAISDGGLLCVTCTDMTVLSGNYPEVCYSKYGVMPLKNNFIHEGSLRILLHALESSATRYKKHIVPWLSMSIDFYIRVFVRVFESPNEVKKSCLKNGMVYQSVQCESFYIQPLGAYIPNKKSKNKKEEDITYHFGSNSMSIPTVCEETGGKLKVGGPYWIYPIHSQEIIEELLNRLENSVVGSKELPIEPSTTNRLKGLLTAMSEELKDVPFYYNLSDMASTLRIPSPTLLEMQSALINAGYLVSQFHRDPMAIKTNAPNKVLWDIMRAFCILHPPQGSLKKKFSEAAKSILSNEIITPNISFEVPAILRDPKKKVARYPPNPEFGWGPKRRAGKLINNEYKETSDNNNDNINCDIHIENHDIPLEKKSKTV